MAKLRDDNFYQIYGWMISKLGLKGTQLSIFAIIYNVSQDGETEYAGSITYLQEFCGGVSKSREGSGVVGLCNGRLSPLRINSG